MSMTCASTNCLDRSGSAPLFHCYGPCGKIFHSKCVGSNNAFLDKINSSNLAFWYCADCKKISLAHFSIKLSNLRNELSKISKGFEELSTNFIKLASVASEIPSLVQVSDKSCSTDDLSTQNVSMSANPKKSKKRGRENSSSSANVSPAPKKPSSSKTNESGGSTDTTSKPVPPPNHEINTIDVETYARPSEPNPSDTPTDKDHSSPHHVPAANNSLPNILTSVPRPKSIFISRLSPETETKDVIEHLVASKIINDSSSIKCSKISKLNSFVASFKITVPNSLFEPILSSPWPLNTLVKEFSATQRRKSGLTAPSGPNSKNCKGSPSTTKM